MSTRSGVLMQTNEPHQAFRTLYQPVLPHEISRTIDGTVRQPKMRKYWTQRAIKTATRYGTGDVCHQEERGNKEERGDQTNGDNYRAQKRSTPKGPPTDDSDGAEVSGQS